VKAQKLKIGRIFHILESHNGESAEKTNFAIGDSRSSENTPVQFSEIDVFLTQARMHKTKLSLFLCFII